MKNRKGFINSTYRQPDEYRCIFNQWTAVFRVRRKEFHVGIDATRESGFAEGKTLTVFVKTAEGRIPWGSFKTIKKAMEYLEQGISKHEFECTQLRREFSLDSSLVRRAFEHIDPETKRPESMIGYSRWDYDGYRWWCNYFPVHDDLKTDQIRAQMQSIGEDFETAFADLHELSQFCHSSKAVKAAGDEYDTFLIRDGVCCWFRIRLWYRDYNLYLYTFDSSKIEEV